MNQTFILYFHRPFICSAAKQFSVEGQCNEIIETQGRFKKNPVYLSNNPAVPKRNIEFKKKFSIEGPMGIKRVLDLAVRKNPVFVSL